jgi:Kdo2-lipid IVA lauroyltransferase/acyltransferase
VTDIEPEEERPRRRGKGGRGRKRPLKRRVLNSAWFHWLIAWYVRWAIGFARLIGRRRAMALSAFVVRLVAPFISENRVGAANLAAAYPEKSDEERGQILRGVWDNLARTTLEFAFLDEIIESFRFHRMDKGPVTVSGLENALKLRGDNKPGLIFAAHLGNWELPAALAQRFGLDLTILFRIPKNSIVAEDLMKRRNELMGSLVASQLGTTFEIASVLANGGHVAMLVDQRRMGSPAVPFFGRPALTSTFFAKLAREYDCPVHGARAIRLPGDRFHIEMTPSIDLPRDSDGLIDVLGASEVINTIIEGWIREHPEQWLWLHDRWRT